MTLQEIKNISLSFAQSDIERLYDIKEMLIGQTKFGLIVGHYADNKFFFYSQCKEIFRNSDKSKAIKFLQNSYTIKLS
jgi:hypothetical protein